MLVPPPQLQGAELDNDDDYYDDDDDDSPDDDDDGPEGRLMTDRQTDRRPPQDLIRQTADTSICTPSTSK